MADSVLIGCCNLITDDDGRYLLVKEAKSVARGRFGLPAGKLEVGETLIEAAVREAREEAGVEVDVQDLVGIYQCPRTSEGSAVVNFVFRSVITAGVPTATEDHPEVGYFSVAQIESMAAEGLIRGAQVGLAIADHRAGRRLPIDLIQQAPPSPTPT